jgi:hypothetical protein
MWNDKSYMCETLIGGYLFLEHIQDLHGCLLLLLFKFLASKNLCFEWELLCYSKFLGCSLRFLYLVWYLKYVQPCGTSNGCFMQRHNCSFPHRSYLWLIGALPYACTIHILDWNSRIRVDFGSYSSAKIASLWLSCFNYFCYPNSLLHSSFSSDLCLALPPV